MRRTSFGIALTIAGGLILSDAAFAGSEPIKLNGGLEAQITQLGRDRSHRHVTVALTLKNTGSQVVFLALTVDPQPIAITNTGGQYAFYEVHGIAKCPNVGTPACIGNSEPRFALPFQVWTEIDPGTGVLVSFTLAGGDNSGPLMSFSANLVYRLVSDLAKDATLTDAQKRQQVRTLPLSFGPMSVTDEA